MKRNISLYIGGSQVDLDNSSLILYNYTAEQLSNPTIIKNEYSQQITIPGTKNNNTLFGSIFRFDRKQIYSDTITQGAYFDASRKIPFAIYNNSDLVESGYVKLDKINNNNGIISYQISLFGGLGSFFYGLSFDTDGNSLTLASLDYGVDLTFKANASSVNAAWNELLGTSTISQDKWNVINFAPCYNGLPEDFACDKVVLSAEDAGLLTTFTEEETVYSPKNGYVIAQLNRDYTELEMQDFRSYLQRPVLSVKRMIQAICDPANNGGYTVDLDPLFFNNNNPYYNNTWLTLPLLSTLPDLTEETIRQDFSVSGAYDLQGDIVLDLADGGTFGNRASVVVTCRPQTQMTSTATNRWYMSSKSATEEVQFFLLVQLVLYSGNTPVEGSEVKIFQTPLEGAVVPEWSVEAVVQRSGYVPIINTQYSEYTSNGTFDRYDYYDCRFSRLQSYILNGESITSVRYRMTTIRIRTSLDEQGNVTGTEALTMPLQLFSSQSDPTTAVDAPNGPFVFDSYVLWQSTSAVRTGATITKEMLLNSEKTPADYLISYCKLFGLSFLADKAEKKISILTRNAMYADSTLIDLTDRIDTSKAITLTPFVFDHRYYNMGYPTVKGQYAENYKNANSADYGDAKINTGYEFDSETKDLLSGIAFNSVVEVLGKSKAYVNITTEGGRVVPAAFLDGGQYSLYDAEGNNMEFDIPIPNDNSTLSYFNDDYNTYDLFSKPQFHEADNKMIEMSDVLLFFQGAANTTAKYPSLKITDDSGIMTLLNDNESCWLWNSSGIAVTQMPMFGRYMWNNASEITHSLDFGTPKELDMPEAVHGENAAIYPRYWKAYIADRYAIDSRIMTAYVDLTGLVVDRNLLRRFFYYQGAVWVLNKINNHSLTTYDNTQCEFVKVIDIANYNNGLNI